jgi:hypothetical protein
MRGREARRRREDALAAGMIAGVTALTGPSRKHLPMASLRVRDIQRPTTGRA